MIFIQLTGLSGAGKTTLSTTVAKELRRLGHKVEVIDGDEYRKGICSDLGFSKRDRLENIRRLGFIGKTLVKHEVIVILSAINPYEEIREELRSGSDFVKTVWIDCDLPTLIERDTKGLYERAFLPEEDPNKLANLTGVNDQFDIPENPDLVIKTNQETESDSAEKLFSFILENINERKQQITPRALFIGRWQPFHNGHRWLIDQKLAGKIPIMIAVRDIAPDSKNPLTTRQTIEILERMYQGKDVKIISLPDIESVNYGRGVGYQINEFSPPETIGMISATEIRSAIRNNDESWKAMVDPAIHDLVIEYLQ